MIMSIYNIERWQKIFQDKFINERVNSIRNTSVTSLFM